MQGVNNFIIRPLKSRYTNTKSIDGNDLILNTDNYNHSYVSKSAVVISIPSAIKTDVKPGDEIITHHNVFRRWKDVRGVEKNSKSYYKEDMYSVFGLKPTKSPSFNPAFLRLLSAYLRTPIKGFSLSIL